MTQQDQYRDCLITVRERLARLDICREEVSLIDSVIADNPMAALRCLIGDVVITPVQQTVLLVIVEWKSKCSLNPTLQEIADELDVSKVTVHQHIDDLEAKGIVTRIAFKSRSIQIVDRRKGMAK